MKIQENKPVIQSTTIGIECDNCGKKHFYSDRKINGPDEQWHHYDTHTDMWGNDSHESYEYYDVCSADCFFAMLEKHITPTNKAIGGLGDGYYINDIPFNYVQKMVQALKKLETA